MVSNDSLVRAEKRLGVPAVVGRYHRALERQLQDDYELGDKVHWMHLDWDWLLHADGVRKYGR